MAKRRKKVSPEEKLYRILSRLTRKFRPDEILLMLSKLYEEYSVASPTEAEIEFWFKCHRATKNLSSGTMKWLQQMSIQLEEGDDDVSVETD